MLKYRLSLFLFTFLIIQSSAQLRDRISLSGEWQFFKGDTEISSQVEHVTVPHSWNAQDGTTADYYRGKGTYRYNFDLPKKHEKKTCIPQIRSGQPRSRCIPERAISR